MSNILEKDRDPLMSDSQTLLYLNDVLSKTSSIVFDEKKIPKRKRFIGERLLNNSIDAYENARAANLLFGNTAKEKKQRVDYEYKAEKAICNLSSDINILPELISSIDHNKGWYNDWQSTTIKAFYITRKWRKSDEYRFSPDNKSIKMQKTITNIDKI